MSAPAKIPDGKEARVEAFFLRMGLTLPEDWAIRASALSSENPFENLFGSQSGDYGVTIAT
jgi:hypothetical protein